MIRVYLYLALILSSSIIMAQNHVSVAPWDNALSYNPSVVGVHTDQSIQMNIFSGRLSPFPIPTTGVLLGPIVEDFINFDEEIPTPQNIKNSYFLGYQKTVSFREKYRFTGALQLQQYQQKRNSSQDITSLGFTFNVHYAISKRRSILNNWSLGYQFNHLVYRPNFLFTRAGYEIFLAPILSFEEYSEQFRGQGSNHAFSINYSYVRKKVTKITVGANFSSYKYKVANSVDPSFSGDIDFIYAIFTLPRVNFEWQQTIGKKLLLELRVYGSLESQAAAGIGARIFKHNLLKFLVVTSPIPIGNPNTLNTYTSVNLSLDMKRYRYILGLGVFNIRFVKFGVSYRFEDRDTSSLISLGH